MKLIEQSSKLWGECPSDPQKAILWIEEAGRVCYRSEDKIVEGSGIKFVNNIIKRKHYSVIEHSNLVVRSKRRTNHPNYELSLERGVFNSPFFNFCIHRDQVYISGNWRTWIEWFNKHNPRNIINTIDDFISNIVNDAVNQEYEVVYDDNIPLESKMMTAEFTTDRAVTHELVRHRPASYSQESQRYVRYDNIAFVKPAWYDTFYTDPELRVRCSVFMLFLNETTEQYRWMIEHGMKAEDARTILPNSTSTKIVMTASLAEWKHVFNLRTSKAAYPQIRNLMTPIYEEFVNREWI